MGLTDKNVINNEDDEIVDDGFILYQNQRLFIMHPHFTDDGYLDLEPLLDYLDIYNLNDIMQSILIFADREILSKHEVEQVFKLDGVFAFVESEEFYRYDDDLQHVLSLVRTYHFIDDDEILPERTIALVRQAIQRIDMFRRTYEYDNTYLPYGHYQKLYTNLAKFFYVFELDAYNNIEELIHRHIDEERPLRKKKGGYAGDYSVMYNPLLNKLFLWDFSKEHMAKLR